MLLDLHPVVMHVKHYITYGCPSALHLVQKARVACVQCRSVSTGAAGPAPGHTTVTQPTQLTCEVKRSKFIATAFPITDPSQALALIQQMSEKDASHNCWAFQVRCISTLP